VLLSVFRVLATRVRFLSPISRAVLVNRCSPTYLCCVCVCVCVCIHQCVCVRQCVEFALCSRRRRSHHQEIRRQRATHLRRERGGARVHSATTPTDQRFPARTATSPTAAQHSRAAAPSTTALSAARSTRGDTPNRGRCSSASPESGTFSPASFGPATAAGHSHRPAARVSVPRCGAASPAVECTRSRRSTDPTVATRLQRSTHGRLTVCHGLARPRTHPSAPSTQRRTSATLQHTASLHRSNCTTAHPSAVHTSHCTSRHLTTHTITDPTAD
jgi:hypothetical protein